MTIETTDKLLLSVGDVCRALSIGRTRSKEGY